MKNRVEPVLILHHAIPAPGSGPNAESDAGVMDEVALVSQAFRSLKIPFRVVAIASLADLPSVLQAAPEVILFNLVENFPGRPADAMQVPTVCAAFEKECTGNESANQTLALDKWRTKAVLQAAGLPVPAGIIIPPGATALWARDVALPPVPWITKPLNADASEGIYPSSVIQGDRRTLIKAVRRIHDEFAQPALVEQYFGTREINIALFQRGSDITVLPVAEIEFRNFGTDRPRIVDYAAKWHTDSFEYRNTVRVVPAPIRPPLAKALQHAALSAWHTLGCRDYARVDFRLDDSGRFVILEVNPNPDISPESGFEAALKAAKIPYATFIHAIYQNALGRRAGFRNPPCSNNSGNTREIANTKARGKKPVIRYTTRSDRDSILGFMRGTGFFHDGEIDVAREVLDDAIAKGPEGHYQSFTLISHGIPAGWICYGPTPCTVGTYDIYWIGIDTAEQGKGYGRALLDHVEKQIRKQQGRLIIIETSGRALYDSTRGFYLKTGYHEAARVPHFYAPDDARVIYSKRLDQA